jgi:hypothetical protein
MGGELEERRQQLAREFPGWRIYAYRAGDLKTGERWNAQPEPVICASSAEELAERIRTAHSQPPDGSPSLASWRSYAARVRALREWEENAAATWKRMRAEADRWRRFPRRHRAGRELSHPDAFGSACGNATPGLHGTPPDITA